VNIKAINCDYEVTGCFDTDNFYLAKKRMWVALIVCRIASELELNSWRFEKC
jgi:hypothetical protein